jgi:hypothetical protein
MYHPMSYHLAQARIADLRHHAQRDILARAARGPVERRGPGLRPWVRRPGQCLAPPRPLSSPRQATHPLAEPAPDIRP